MTEFIESGESGESGSPGEARASDAPVRDPGTRARSGNAMLRTRHAILEAAAGCVQRYGVRKTTMSDLATQAKVAKATLYNHFRTKDDVMAALVTLRVEALGARCVEAARDDLGAALVLAAEALAADGALRRVASEEPEVLARVAVPGSGRTWDVVRAAAAGVLEAAEVAPEPPAVDLLLRWAVSQATWPGTREEAELGAGVLARGLAASRGAHATEPSTTPGSHHEHRQEPAEGR